MSHSPQQALATLHAHAQTVQLATLDEYAQPAISYAPFVSDEAGNFYVFISGLASHTQDLLRQPTVAVMLIADEQNTRQIFARTRATYQCVAEVVARETPEARLLLDALQARFGEVVGVLRGLGDFVLFRLKPQTGRFVMGFGQAFTLTGERLQTLQPIVAGKG